MWTVIRGNQQGGQGGLVGSEQSTTKQPFSSLAASLRGASRAYLSSRLLNRLTSGSHPAHTHTLSPLWFPQTQRNHDLAAASLTTLTFSLTSRSSAMGRAGTTTRWITRKFTSTVSTFPLHGVQLSNLLGRFMKTWHVLFFDIYSEICNKYLLYYVADERKQWERRWKRKPEF